MNQRSLPGRSASIWVPLLLIGLHACADANGTFESPLAPSYAKPGTADPTVASVEPSSAPQDTTLDLTVGGADFDAGSVVALTLGGVSSGDVVTNRTTYVSSRKLIANVTISADALVASYDVEVTTSRGKKGVATESFAVLARGNVDTDSRAMWEVRAVTLDGSASGLIGDGRDGDGSPTSGASVYEGDRCGVFAKIFAANPSMSGSGDAVLYPDREYRETGCGAPRTLDVRLSPSAVTSIWFTNVKCVMQLTPGWSGSGCAYPDASIDPNDPTVGYAAISANTSDRVCERVWWSPEVTGGTANGNVKVTYLGATGPNGERQWRAETQPPHAAGCWVTRKGKTAWDGVRRVIPFHVVITEVPYTGF